MKEIQRFAEVISKKAGAILLSGFRAKSTTITYKRITDIVTNMDRKSEEYLCEAIQKRFPEHAIVAEEGSSIESASDLVWYIDPLDATNNYAHGIPFFCISIGIFSKSLQKVMVGVVYDPVHDELFSAYRGGGAHINSTPIHVSKTGSLNRAFLATGFPVNRDNACRDNIEEFSRLALISMGIRRIGSAALDLCYTACGRFDGYWEPELQPWDMAAGALIVEEAGGMVTRYDGSAFIPSFPEIIATNGKIHEEVLRYMRR